MQMLILSDFLELCINYSLLKSSVKELFSISTTDTPIFSSSYCKFSRASFNSSNKVFPLISSEDKCTYVFSLGNLSNPTFFLLALLEHAMCNKSQIIFDQSSVIELRSSNVRPALNLRKSITSLVNLLSIFIS